MGGCCCSSETEATSQTICPGCGNKGNLVTPETIRLHLLQPWLWLSGENAYHFCHNSGCEVVYFSDGTTPLTQAALATPVGIKSRDDEDPLCYCYHISRGEYRRNPDLKDFVVKQTQEEACACESRNPSGRCCLGDFSRFDPSTTEGVE